MCAPGAPASETPALSCVLRLTLKPGKLTRRKWEKAQPQGTSQPDQSGFQGDQEIPPNIRLQGKKESKSGSSRL